MNYLTRCLEDACYNNSLHTILRLLECIGRRYLNCSLSNWKVRRGQVGLMKRD